MTDEFGGVEMLPIKDGLLVLVPEPISGEAADQLAGFFRSRHPATMVTVVGGARVARPDSGLLDSLADLMAKKVVDLFSRLEEGTDAEP